MKKSDLVKLKNDNYKSHNLTKDMHGIVIKTNYDNADVLFLTRTTSETMPLSI